MSACHTICLETRCHVSYVQVRVFWIKTLKNYEFSTLSVFFSLGPSPKIPTVFFLVQATSR